MLNVCLSFFMWTADISNSLIIHDVLMKHVFSDLGIITTHNLEAFCCLCYQTLPNLNP